MAIPVCPCCGGPLEAVEQSHRSSLNAEQWDSVRAGDWLCRSCPQSKSMAHTSRLDAAYFWDHQVSDRMPQTVGDGWFTVYETSLGVVW